MPAGLITPPIRSENLVLESPLVPHTQLPLCGGLLEIIKDTGLRQQTVGPPTNPRYPQRAVYGLGKWSISKT